MIVSENRKASLSEFQELMQKTDILLNKDAKNRPSYYSTRGGNPLEDDVEAALIECAKDSPFENTIRKVSGHSFPDIVAGRYYGVEVKSTVGNKWKSTGSSILESTRNQTVDRIYLTFGKLGSRPIEFISRPYEECLYGIAVTHMPRYLIDMELDKGQTIFDKLGISYDELRMMDNPVVPVSRYYRSKLKPGESLWWAGDSPGDSVDAKIRLWKTLKLLEKRRCTIFGCVNFPEVFCGDYDRYALWLTSQGIVDSHIRDQFSSGGQETLFLSDGSLIKAPGIYRRIKENIDLFVETMRRKDTEDFMCDSFVDNSTLGNRMMEWAVSASGFSPLDNTISIDAFKNMFQRVVNDKYLVVS